MKKDYYEQDVPTPSDQVQQREPTLLDDEITMESIVEEDPLYNRFMYNQLRAMSDMDPFG